jgi:hypothetical protein
MVAICENPLEGGVSKRTDVRFGSKADMRSAKRHFRFTPNSDRKSRHAANGHVCFTPNSGHVRCSSACLLWAKSGLMQRSKWECYSITSSARASSCGGMVRPSAFAVLRLIVSTYLVGACTGKSAGFSPLSMRSA